MNARKKKILILIGLVIFIGIQFYRPLKGERIAATLDDLILANKPSERVADLLINTCYDCHSNQTRDYWYTNVVPAAWLLDKDVKEGKSKLNFSEWEQYSFEEKIDLAGQIMHEMYEGNMPLKGYTFMHREAILKKTEQNEITNWINSLVE